MLTPSILALLSERPLHPWALRHAHIHTTYPLGYVKNLTFGSINARKKRHGR
jgi:hypothetical protein